MKYNKVYYFEVSFAPKGEKARWVRPTQEPSKSFIECQDKAIANNERPYRIKEEAAPVEACTTSTH